MNCPEPNFFGPGVETEEDEKRLLTQLEFIKRLMSDLGWRTLPQICQAYTDATDKPVLETSVSAALRALRRPKHGGFDVDRELQSPGLYRYRVRPGEELVALTKNRKVRIVQ